MGRRAIFNYSKSGNGRKPQLSWLVTLQLKSPAKSGNGRKRSVEDLRARASSGKSQEMTAKPPPLYGAALPRAAFIKLAAIATARIAMIATSEIETGILIQSAISIFTPTNVSMAASHCRAAKSGR